MNMKKLKLIKYGLICLIAIMIIGVLFLLNKSYAFFNYTKESNKINTASASGIDAKIISGENNLEINNSYPIYDSEGMLKDAFVFNLTNAGNLTLTYTVKVLNDTDKQEGSVIPDNFIKYSYSLDGVNYTTPTTLSLTNNIIVSNNLIKGSSDTIYLKIWLSSEADNSVSGKSYSGKVIVSATK